jgi:hypothetical protein
MSSSQEPEITIERAKEYFEDLKKHCKAFSSIITDSEIEMPKE